MRDRSRRAVSAVRLAAWLAAGGLLFACSGSDDPPADDGGGGSVDPEAESRELRWDEGEWDNGVWG